MNTRLTERQNQALEYIRSHLRLHRRPPTYAEIGKALDMRSTNGVSKLLDVLEQKGYLRRERHSARSIELLDERDDLFNPHAAVPNLPVASRTASHEPHLLRSNPRGSLFVDPLLLGRADPDACLIVQAGDDGMNGDGIRKGDLLVVEETPLARLPQEALVAALVQEDLLARRYSWLNKRIHLRPADRTYTEEVFPDNDPGCHVIGRVLCVFRRLRQ